MIPMGIPWELGNRKMPKMGMGKVHVTVETSMATFLRVPKFPSVDSMRMQSNKMLYRHISFREQYNFVSEG